MSDSSTSLAYGSRLLLIALEARTVSCPAGTSLRMTELVISDKFDRYSILDARKSKRESSIQHRGSDMGF